VKIAFDLDGTSWTHRELFREITQGLKARGHTVGILTAHHTNLREADIALWKDRGFVGPDFWIGQETVLPDIQATVNWKKQVCRDNDIDYLFDDWFLFRSVEIFCTKHHVEPGKEW